MINEHDQNDFHCQCRSGTYGQRCECTYELSREHHIIIYAAAASLIKFLLELNFQSVGLSLYALVTLSYDFMTS